MANQDLFAEEEKREEIKLSKPMTKSVTSQYSKKGELISSEEENAVIDVLQFEVDRVASVSAKYGVTINMGNWESCRFDAMVTVPCYTEEIDNAMTFATKKAEEYVKEQASSYLDKRSDKNEG